MARQTLDPHYYQMQKGFVPTLNIPPEAVIEQRFPATSKSSSVIRFRINSTSPDALMHNRIRVYLPLRFQSNERFMTEQSVGINQFAAADLVPELMFRGDPQRIFENVSIQINNSASVTWRASELADLMECIGYSGAGEKLPCGYPSKADKDGELRHRSLYYLGTNVGVEANTVQGDATRRVDPGAACRRLRAAMNVSAATTTAVNGLDMSDAGALLDYVIYFDLCVGQLAGSRYRFGPEFGDWGSSGYLPYQDQLEITMQFRSTNRVGTELFQVPEETTRRGNAADGGSRRVANPAINFIGLTPNVDPTCHVLFTQAKGLSLPPAVNCCIPRFLHFVRERAAVPPGNAFEANFTNIKVEAMPSFICLYCEVNPNDPRRTELQYAGRFAPLTVADDQSPSVLTISSSESGGIATSYSKYQLWQIYSKNLRELAPRCPVQTFEAWSRSRCVILLKPSDIPPCSERYIYKPQVISLKVSYDNSFGYAGQRDLIARMSFLYADQLTISPGSASVSSVLVSEQQSQPSQGGAVDVEQTGDALDKMEVKY